MGIELKWMAVAVVAVALLGTGPVPASRPPQSPGTPDKGPLGHSVRACINFPRRDPDGNGRAKAASIHPGDLCLELSI